MNDNLESVNEPSEQFGAVIAELRVRKGLTQAALAQNLGVTHQAVSQWECGDTMPDIMLLPALAALLGVSIDYLFFGKSKNASCQNLNALSPEDIPENDGKLRALLFIGNKQVKSADINKKLADENRIIFEYRGPALNVASSLSLQCGDVNGNASSSQSIKCGNIQGNASAGHSLSCGDVNQNANAGHSLSASGSVGGGAKAGHGLICGNITGDVKAGHSVVVKGSVKGNIKSLRYKEENCSQ